MDYKLPIPSNWQDFESICHHLWKEIWNDPNAQKNGRNGQKQNGVDIFGTPIYSKYFSGVQCKKKDYLLGSYLKESEIIDECNNAKKFSPAISSFSLATTTPRDSNMQKIARELTDQEVYPFSVQIWSWDDIQTEIVFRPLILGQYYSVIPLPEKEQMKVSLNRYSPEEQIQAYFTRPLIKSVIPSQLLNYLIKLSYELSDNAYKYGKATMFNIEFDENKVVFKDNGEQFNPITDLNPGLACAKNNIGSFVFETFRKKYERAVKPIYNRILKNNIDYNSLEFEFIGNVTTPEKKDYMEIYVNLNAASGRLAAKRRADSIIISPEIKEIILTITFNVAMSFSVEFIRLILQRLNRTQKLILSVPRDEMFSKIDEWFNDDRVIVKRP